MGDALRAALRPFGLSPVARSQAKPAAAIARSSDRIAATFEFAGGVIAVLALAFAVILAAPFMLLGWLMARMGLVR